jgi:hypothetical protein
VKLTLANKIGSRFLLPLSLAMLSIFYAGLPVKAETTDSISKIATADITGTAKQSASSLNQPTEQIIQVDQVAELSLPINLEEGSQSIPTVSGDFLTQSSSPNLVTTSTNSPQVAGFTKSPLGENLAVNNSLEIKTVDTQEAQPQLVSDLTAIPVVTAKQLKEQSTPSQSFIAQTDSNGAPLFRPTRSGPNYIGIGGNFGITGDSDLGGRSLAIISKFGLSDVWSVRPSVLFLSNFASFLIPITYDFPPQQFLTPDLTIAPYLGGGVAITTGSDNTFGPLLTAGIDIPLSRNFTANIAANLAFIRTTDLGILVGIAYNF